MAFQLEAGETLAAGLGRIAAEGRAGAGFPPRADRPRAGVLEARKSLKKVRAILRLSRTPLGKRRFRDENRRYRDLARQLAEQRAGVVRVEALDELAQSMDGEAPRQELQARADDSCRAGGATATGACGKRWLMRWRSPGRDRGLSLKGSTPSVPASPARIARDGSGCARPSRSRRPRRSTIGESA